MLNSDGNPLLSRVRIPGLGVKAQCLIKHIIITFTSTERAVSGKKTTGSALGPDWHEGLPLTGIKQVTPHFVTFSVHVPLTVELLQYCINKKKYH